MPELPEVETIRRELEREVVGKRVKSVEVPGRGAVTRLPKKQFVTRLEGVKVSG
ncbi:MAG: DNA-formamidopyrimidine glycosylase, partial [Acidimicrobiia bacterium]|nr:DNA-formamidopyrimidine glycosylase [Acidimicrobiia bacterium]